MNSPNSDVFLSCIGCHHSDAPLDVRERYALAKDAIPRLYDNLTSLDLTREVLLLNTCNRTEVYCVSHKQPIEHQHIVDCLYNSDFSGEHLRKRHGIDSVRHIFSVACGLDSQILGENEIHGQLKAAYQNAQELGTVGPILNKLCQKTLQTAKWVRSNTQIAKGHVSIGSVCAELASRIFGNLSESRILVVGGGEVGRDTLKALKVHGAQRIAVTNRTEAKAHELALELEGIAIPFDSFKQRLHEFDIVITSTASGERLINKADLLRAPSTQFYIDLSVPRNIDPEIAHIDGIYLYNMDDIAAIANENMQSRMKEIQHCKDHIESRSQYLWEQLKRFLSS